MDIQYFKELLHNRKLKATTPRLSLLTKMQAYQSAMPYSAIQEAMKSIDRVTLYRTLESLKNKGIIHKAFQENNQTYYAICGKKCNKNHHSHDHIHFKCVSCKAVTCQKPSQNIQVAIPDHEIYKVSIHIEGICKICTEK